jgi:hypothetical protein
MKAQFVLDQNPNTKYKLKRQNHLTHLEDYISFLIYSRLVPSTGIKFRDAQEK